FRDGELLFSVCFQKLNLSLLPVHRTHVVVDRGLPFLRRTGVIEKAVSAIGSILFHRLGGRRGRCGGSGSAGFGIVAEKAASAEQDDGYEQQGPHEKDSFKAGAKLFCFRRRRLRGLRFKELCAFRRLLASF